MNPSSQPAPGVLSIFESFISSERVGGRARHCCQPGGWPLTSTTQYLIQCLVKRSQPLVLDRKRKESYTLGKPGHQAIKSVIINVPSLVVLRQPRWNSPQDMLFWWHSWKCTIKRMNFVNTIWQDEAFQENLFALKATKFWQKKTSMCGIWEIILHPPVCGSS